VDDKRHVSALYSLCPLSPITFRQKTFSAKPVKTKKKCLPNAAIPGIPRRRAAIHLLGISNCIAFRHFQHSWARPGAGPPTLHLTSPDQETKKDLVQTITVTKKLRQPS
jgi:hypothetical protein